MNFYEDLPEGLQPLFPKDEFPGFPEAIRQLLTDAWYVMKPNDQGVLRNNLHSKKGLNRALYATNQAVRALWARPHKDTLKI